MQWNCRSPFFEESQTLLTSRAQRRPHTKAGASIIHPITYLSINLFFCAYIPTSTPSFIHSFLQLFTLSLHLIFSFLISYLSLLIRLAPSPSWTPRWRCPVWRLYSLCGFTARFANWARQPLPMIQTQNEHISTFLQYILQLGFERVWKSILNNLTHILTHWRLVLNILGLGSMGNVCYECDQFA